MYNSQNAKIKADQATSDFTIAHYQIGTSPQKCTFTVEVVKNRFASRTAGRIIFTVKIAVEALEGTINPSKWLIYWDIHCLLFLHQQTKESV